MSKQMTPCEKLGYKVGDEFEVISHHAFKKGQVVTLHEDDGTECPLFAGDGGGAGVFDGVECSFATLNQHVMKIANKLKPAKQALADAINQNCGLAEGGDWHKNGELPPVGEVCKAYIDYPPQWVETEIVAHKDGFAIGWCKSVMKGCHGDKAHEFRPLRTEREKAIDEMVEVLKSAIQDTKTVHKICASALYNAGYRKEVK